MSKDTEFRVEQVEALARGLAPDVLEAALSKTLEKLVGVPREALEAMMRGSESGALTKKVSLDVVQLKTLPPETLAALAQVLFEEATDFSTLDPPKTDATAPVAGDLTQAFTGQVWKPDASQASFRAFYEQYASLSMRDFLEQHRTPLLLSSISFDRSTWSGALVLPVKKRDPNDPEKAVTVGRDPSCDVVIPHASVSKHHVKLTLQDGKWFLTDTKSANGTKVDDVAIEPEKPVRMRDVTHLDLSGARLTFNTPASVFHFIEQVKKLEGHKTQRLQRQAALPKGFEQGAKPVEAAPKKSSDKLPAAKAEAVKKKMTSGLRVPALPPEEESKAKEALRGVASLIGTPQRLAATIVLGALLIFSIVRMGPPLAFMLFGEEHPEWFEKDLPDYLKKK